jgi:hypothetical protein
MAPHHRKATHSKAEEDATPEANITAAIKAVRENQAKNLLAAAGEFNVPYHTLQWHAQNLTKPHLKAHKHTGTFSSYIHWYNQDEEAGGPT